jgi:hypothetical protein
MRRFWCGMILLLASGFAGLVAQGDDPPAAGEAVVTDVEGKEFKLTNVKFGTGTRRLAWLADPKGTTEDAKKGPLALEIRELTSCLPLAKGILTLVPVSSLESAKYNYETQLVSFNVKGLKEPVVGTLVFAKINALGFSGTSGGKTAAFTGGALSKSAVKTATFSGAEALPKRKESSLWNIQIVKTKDDQPKTDTPMLRAHNLKVLYSFPDGSEYLADGIPVRKGEPIPFDEKLQRFEMVANDLNTNIAVAEVETMTGARDIIIPPTLEKDKKTGTLVGILGEVDGGWKLFPLHTVKVIKPSMRKIE